MKWIMKKGFPGLSVFSKLEKGCEDDKVNSDMDGRQEKEFQGKSTTFKECMEGDNEPCFQFFKVVKDILNEILLKYNISSLPLQVLSMNWWLNLLITEWFLSSEDMDLMVRRTQKVSIG